MNVITHQLDNWRGLIDRAFVARWDALARECTEPNAFCESWFLQPALRQFDCQGSVKIFTLWDGAKLCGLMPLSFKRRYGRWLMPHVQNWLHHNAFLGTPLVRQGYEDIFWRALLTQLDCHPGSALFFHINGIPTEGPLSSALQRVSAEQQRRIACVEDKARALLEGALSPDVYFENAVRPKKRKELRRQKNRLAEEGVLTFLRQEDGEGLDVWIAEFLALEQRGWKGANGSALACAAETRNLFVETLRGAAAAGQLERLELRLDGKPLAMLVNFLAQPGSFSFKTAFDEDYARYSPGVLLQIENLALLEKTGIDWCDSCAAEGHPMIDSLWTGRRHVGRYSIAIGGWGRRAIFGRLVSAELARNNVRRPAPTEQGDREDEQ
jgi:CelD/BcsL family acetyltransferase involved in cellulose biosynthesis